MDATDKPSRSPLRAFAAAWLATALCALCVAPLLGIGPLLSVLFPPLAMAYLKFHASLLPFLAVPAGLALAAAVVLARAVRAHIRSTFWLAVLFNVAFLGTLVAGLETTRAWWMAKEARAIGAQCRWSRPFVESVALRRERGDHALAHAMAANDDDVFIWSYSERRFVPDARAYEGGCAGMPERWP